MITNRNTGYRWILRRGRYEVEFQTPGMFEEQVGEQTVEIYLAVEEAEALARAAKASEIKDRRTKALVDQALDQIGIVCRQVRERVRAADTFLDSWTRRIPRASAPPPELNEQEEEQVQKPRIRYRPLGDPDNLTLKEAGEILGKARNTVYLWYRKGKLPPAVDVGPHIGKNKPVIVVPRYRLEAWQRGERMPGILREVFDSHILHEAPWTCLTAKRGASREDVAFWVERRNLSTGTSKDGRRIYGQGLEEGRIYELVETRSPTRPGHVR